MNKKQVKTEVPKKIIVTFGGDKMSGKTSLMNLLIKELTKNKIKYVADPAQHMLCVETKRQEIVDLIHKLKEQNKK